MKRCVSCARVLVLMNGLADREFNMERGLSQDCPLSLLLFTLVAKTLLTLVYQFEDNH